MMDNGEEPEATSQAPHVAQSAFPRSCDTCRARKIRCNRQQPCRGCVVSKTQCTYIDVLKPREKRSRILLTEQYENKIDSIDRQLGEVITLLQTLPDGLKRTQTSSQTVCAVRGPPSSEPQSTTSPVMEGESSLAAQASFADEFMQKVADAASISGRNSHGDLQESSQALSHIVSEYKGPATSQQESFPHARPSHRSSFHGCELPPIEQTVVLIRLAESQRLAGSGWIYQYLPINHFSKTCLEVYFSNQYSETDFIIVNAGLYSMFKDYGNITSGEEEKARYLENANMCRSHLETALSSLPLHLPTTSNSIIALVFGAYHAIELSKPFLAWSLSSKASELCQSLGYHRATPVDQDTAEDVQLKRLLFWTTYFIDKSLSLRLGRATTIPDWTITTPRPSVTDPHQQPVMAYFVLWVETARCQGNIYEMLYSPDATAQPVHVLQARVQRLVTDLQDLEKATVMTNRRWLQHAKDKSGDDLLDFFASSDETLRLSLLTLVYRAAPHTGSTATFNADCVRAARATLDSHKNCVAIMGSSSRAFAPTYFQWTILFAPFVPYIVIFCHVIETQDEADLQRLGDFVASMEPAAHSSEATSKTHGLFQALYDIAFRCTELRTMSNECGRGSGDPHMDWFLESVGIVTSGQEMGGEQTHVSGSLNSFDMATESAAHGARNSSEAENHHDGLRALACMGHEAELEAWLHNNEFMP